MEFTPRITSVYEKEDELRRKLSLRERAERQRVEARKKAVTAFAIIRAVLRMATTPNRESQGRILRQNMRIAREGRRVVAGDRDRIAALGRRILATR